MKYSALLIWLLVFSFVNGQDIESEIIDNFEDYADLSREQVYLHFNKSTYILGEMLGFNAYVFLKDAKQLSDNTTNLYCQILDSEDKVVKEKLILVTNGISRGEFEIDSLFTTGEYKIKAYTNWMRNFNNEHNHFQENFKVIDPATSKEDKSQTITDDIDLQFLPESGHLLSESSNVIGVIAKDKLGNGVSGLNLKVYDKTDVLIGETTLNAYGIGSFVMRPKLDDIYTVKYSYNEKVHELKLPEAESNGVILSVKKIPRRDNIVIQIKTNMTTLNQIKRKRYKLNVHNGSEIKEVQFAFTDSDELTQTMTTDQLFKGINIFTVFNEENRPIAERMYFNYEGLNLASQSYTIFNTINNDSIGIRVAMPNVKLDQFQNLSISVLPSETKSYDHHQNIISNLYLHPYLRSSVEHANYYFTNITEEKKYELDKLLLTQGWSSYDWGMIFNESPEDNFAFEVGLNYTINRNDIKKKNLIIYPNINSDSEILTLSANQKSFEKRGFFPLDEETIKIGEFTNNGKVGPTSLALQYSLLDIKTFSTNYKPKTVLKSDQSSNTVIEELNASEGERLDEVKVFAKRKYTRIEKLRNRNLGSITEFNDELTKQYRTIGQFLSSRGFIVEDTPNFGSGEEPSLFRISVRVPRTINGPIIPTIFLDGALLVNFDILSQFSMRTVDYVSINKGGVGEGLRASAGVIRIVTDPEKRLLTQKQKPRVSYSEYKLPLTFTTPKQFYIPKYRSFESPFFNEYGVVDWFPNVVVGNDGYLTLKVLDTGVPIKLFIEGVVNTEQLISDVITIGEN